jgi:DNA repair protein RecN (Recombination protein N)
VAAQAHTQFRVVKQSDGRVTRTAVSTLTPTDRVDEIARMLGGIDITDQARAHAEEMLALVTVAAQAEPPARKKRARSAPP